MRSSFVLLYFGITVEMILIQIQLKEFIVCDGGSVTYLAIMIHMSIAFLCGKNSSLIDGRRHSR